MQQYRTELLAFGQALMSLPEGDPTSVSDVNKVTGADLEAATTFVTAMHSALDKLEAIKPPAEIAGPHQKLADAITSLVAATDKSMQALQEKDQAALVAAQSDASALSEQILTLLGELQTYLGSLQL
jgi:hypothetical protein